LNGRNYLLDDNLRRVEFSEVQQVNDRAFFRRGDRWVDSRLVREGKNVEPKRTVRYGTAEFDDLAERLKSQGRAGAMSVGRDVLLEVDGEAVRLSY
jgi:hypothetical protein